MIVRDSISQRGHFARVLVAYFDEPNNFDRLMDVVKIADRPNLYAFEKALEEAGLLPNEPLTLSGIFNVYYGIGCDMRPFLQKQFEILNHLDEDVENPFSIPVRKLLIDIARDQMVKIMEDNRWQGTDREGTETRFEIGDIEQTQHQNPPNDLNEFIGDLIEVKTFPKVDNQPRKVTRTCSQRIRVSFFENRLHGGQFLDIES